MCSEGWGGEYANEAEVACLVSKLTDTGGSELLEFQSPSGCP